MNRYAATLRPCPFTFPNIPHLTVAPPLRTTPPTPIPPRNISRKTFSMTSSRREGLDRPFNLSPSRCVLLSIHGALGLLKYGISAASSRTPHEPHILHDDGHPTSILPLSGRLCSLPVRRPLRSCVCAVPRRRTTLAPFPLLGPGALLAPSRSCRTRPTLRHRLAPLSAPFTYSTPACSGIYEHPGSSPRTLAQLKQQPLPSPHASSSPTTLNSRVPRVTPPSQSHSQEVQQSDEKNFKKRLSVATPYTSKTDMDKSRSVHYVRIDYWSGPLITSSFQPALQSLTVTR